ncbi:MAG: ArsR family transcriptional regulator [Ignisphaera sp.]
MSRRGSSEKVIQYDRERIQGTDLGLRIIYEDPEIVVITAPNEDELRDIVLDMLREGPKTLKEMHSRLAGIASEDKIRRCIIRLEDEGIVIASEDGRYKLLGSDEYDGELIPEEG